MVQTATSGRAGSNSDPDPDPDSDPGPNVDAVVDLLDSNAGELREVGVTTDGEMSYSLLGNGVVVRPQSFV